MLRCDTVAGNIVSGSRLPQSGGCAAAQPRAFDDSGQDQLYGCSPLHPRYPEIAIAQVAGRGSSDNCYRPVGCDHGHPGR